MFRVMVFIDGSNVMYTAKLLRANFRVSYLKLAQTLAGSRMLVRTYYFGSEGTPPPQKQIDFYEKLKRLRINVIKRPVRRKGDRMIEKGVDVALTTEMLSLGFMNAYDIAILVSGDNDYVGAVQKLKDVGKIVEVAAFECGLGRELRLSADKVIILDDIADSFEL